MTPDNAPDTAATPPRLESVLATHSGSHGAPPRWPPDKGRSLSPGVLADVVAAMDAAVMLVTGLVIYLAYLGWSADNVTLYFSALATHTTAVLAVFYFAGLYEFSAITEPGEQIKKVVVLCSIVSMVLITAAFALKVSAQFSRVWAFSWFLSSMVCLCVTRQVIHLMLRRWARRGQLTRNLVLVGTGQQAVRLLEHFGANEQPWYRVLGVFDERIDRGWSPAGVQPLMGNIDDLLDFARNHRVDDIIITLPWSADERVRAVVARLVELPVNVRLGPDLAGFLYPGVGRSFIGAIPMLDVAHKPLRGWRFLIKALEDRVLALVMLLLAAPLMALIALAIKLDTPGPVLFRQLRYGFNDKLISVLKFRTMHHEQGAARSMGQARRNDPRVTRVGRLLRRSSLDELPQLFNVLTGSMSLVGPRPHPVEFTDDFRAIVDGFSARHRVKPGITGWAQVHGLRGETEKPEKMRARFEHDIHYIDNWSLWLDLKILLLTVKVVLSQKNAY